MTDLSNHWACGGKSSVNNLFWQGNFPITRRLDIAGVASSILATPTMIRPWKSSGF